MEINEYGAYQVLSNGGAGPALSVYGNTQVSENRNVILWERQDISDQIWLPARQPGSAQNWALRSGIDPAYGLNLWRGRANNGNCDIHTTAGNAADAALLLQAAGGGGLFRIGLANHGLYLTAMGDASGADVRWQSPDPADARQVWRLAPVGPYILRQETQPPKAVAAAPLIIHRIPDKTQPGGYDSNVEYHPGCGFVDGLEFEGSAAGQAVEQALQSYVAKVFGPGAALSHAQTCYYLYGERIRNGAGNQFHPGVDVNYRDGAPVYALYGGRVVYAGGSYGTVSISVPEKGGIVTNYVHLKGIRVKKGEAVAAGQPIGCQGSTGTGASHLHFEVRPKGTAGPVYGPTRPDAPMTTIRPYGYMDGR